MKSFEKRIISLLAGLNLVAVSEAEVREAAQQFSETYVRTSNGSAVYCKPEDLSANVHETAGIYSSVNILWGECKWAHYSLSCVKARDRHSVFTKVIPRISLQHGKCEISVIAYIDCPYSGLVSDFFSERDEEILTFGTWHVTCSKKNYLLVYKWDSISTFGLGNDAVRRLAKEMRSWLRQFAVNAKMDWDRERKLSAVFAAEWASMESVDLSIPGEVK